jgi:hypothetical protein
MSHHLIDYARDRVESATVTLTVRTASGRTITYEFHNIGFAPNDVLREGHGIAMESEQRTLEEIRDRYSVAMRPTEEPPVLTLTVKGELRAGDDGATHTIATREPTDGD